MFNEVKTERKVGVTGQKLMYAEFENQTKMAEREHSGYCASVLTVKHQNTCLALLRTNSQYDVIKE